MIFEQGQKSQKTSKSVKTLFDMFRATPIFRRLLGCSDSWFMDPNVLKEVEGSGQRGSESPTTLNSSRRLSEVFRLGFLCQTGQESAEKFAEPLFLLCAIPPLHVAPLPLRELLGSGLIVEHRPPTRGPTHLKFSSAGLCLACWSVLMHPTLYKSSSSCMLPRCLLLGEGFSYVRGGNSTRKNPPKIKKKSSEHVFLNNFRRAPDSCHREKKQKFERTFRKSSCKRGVFFGISGFWVGFWGSIAVPSIFVYFPWFPLKLSLMLILRQSQFRKRRGEGDVLEHNSSRV